MVGGLGQCRRGGGVSGRSGVRESAIGVLVESKEGGGYL